jgi:DNA-binding Xre family transcriptional regulator
MRVRLRLPELLHETGMTAYRVAKASGGRINESTLYRLVRAEGRVDFFAAELLEALSDVLGVDPGELLERERSRPKGKRKRRP